MPKLHYRIVQHDGGWAYTFEGVFSEPFPTQQAAREAATHVVAEHHTPGDTTTIEYQDAAGEWHTETTQGSDRPDVDVT